MGGKVSEDSGTEAHAGGVEELTTRLWIEHEERRVNGEK